MTWAQTRNLLYQTARVMGDVSAARNGTVGKRIMRRFVGKMTGRMLRQLFR